MILIRGDAVKRLISAAMALLLLSGVFLLPACGSSEKNKDTTSFITTAKKPTEMTPSTTKKGDNSMTPEMIDKNAAVYDMRVESMVLPVGIDDTAPVFSWKINSDTLGWAQTAYQLVVKKGDAIVWDSGKVESGESVGVAYAGEALVSSTEYTWQVSVFNHKGEKTISAPATFETGLLGARPFGNAKWISYEKAPLYTGTAYSVDLDFIIHRDNLGFCFGMQDAGSFVMWQINTYNGQKKDGKVLLRPHFKSGGNWTAYPGGPGNVQAIDITDAVGYTASELIGKTAHLRIEVDGRIVKTYLGKTADSLTLASTYTHSANIPLYDIGFRHSTQSGNDHEVASYDNVVVKDSHGKILYENSFTTDTVDFAGAAPIEVQNGMLRVGTDTAAGEFIFTRMGQNSLPAFRKAVSVKADLVSAKLYTAGLGVYEAYVNGERVGRRYADGTVEYHELKPGFTEMEEIGRAHV